MNQEISAAFLYLNTVVLHQKWLNTRYFGVNTCISRLQMSEMTETNPSNTILNFYSSCYGGGGGVINILTIYPFFAVQFQVIQGFFFYDNWF